jgi:branched-chain amino acid transport system substrate-binding protein
MISVKGLRFPAIIAAAALLFLAVGHATAAEPIKIGWFGPLSGPASLLGQDSLRGTQFAIKQVNAAGGINGRQVTLISYDDRTDKKEAVSIAQRLVGRDEVVAILGGSLSGTSVAAAPIISQAKTPMIAAYSNAFQVVKGNDYVWRWASVADVQGYVMVHYVRTALKKEKMAVLSQDDEYGKGIARGVKEGVKRWGGTIVFEKSYPIGEKEFRASLTEIKRLKPDAVLSMGLGPSQASVARQGAELGVFPAAQMIASCTADDLNWFNTVGAEGEGTIGVLEFATGEHTPQVQEFLKGWERDYKTRIVSHEAGTSYDATRMLLEAVRRGGATREGVKKALDGMKEFKGLIGPPHVYTKMREPAYPLAIGVYRAAKKEYEIIKYYSDPDIIDPTRWASYY